MVCSLLSRNFNIISLTFTCLSVNLDKILMVKKGDRLFNILIIIINRIVTAEDQVSFSCSLL